MGVSANTLFHFTNKNNLISILKNKFHPKYHLEDLRAATPRIKLYKEAYIPMVCFCDLLFSQIKDHIDFYGDYGLGLKKMDWGIEWGISPIIYLPNASKSAIHFQKMYLEFTERFKDNKNIREQLQNFYKYLKPYRGKAQNKTTGKKRIKIFYDEREWRYVPDNFPVISKYRITKKGIRKRNEKLGASEKLSFKAKDIKYIIVKHEKEIPEFVKFIENDLKGYFKSRERKILVSKLISVKQIKEDV